MKIEVGNNGHSLKQIAQMLRKDPESWEKWSAVHVHSHRQDTAHYPEGLIRKMIQESLKNRSGHAYVLPDGDILILVRSTPAGELRLLAGELQSVLCLHSEEAATFRLYNLEDDWRQFAFTCETKSQCFPDCPKQNAGGQKIEDANEIFDFYPVTLQHKENRTVRKVLVVEDDPLTRRMVSKVLRDEVELVTAEDVDEALVHYVLHAPDVVFLDIDLPGMDGKALLRTIMDHDPHANVVMFSSNSYMENILETMAIGAMGFVGKPFRKEQLMHYIEKGK